MNTTIKLPETIEDAKEELAQLFFQCASYERPSTDWIKALDSFTEQVATTALEAAEARHDQELLAYQIRVDRLEAELAQPERKPHTEAEVQALIDAGQKLAAMRYSDAEFEQYTRRILGVQP